MNTNRLIHLIKEVALLQKKIDEYHTTQSKLIDEIVLIVVKDDDILATQIKTSLLFRKVGDGYDGQSTTDN